MKNKLIIEFIGTFFLVFTVGCAAVLGYAGAMAPLAIGSILMVMVFMGGHISGGMYNPAVSLAVMLRGKLSSKEFLGYVVVQLLAGIVAALIVSKVINSGARMASAGDVNIKAAVFAEFLFTFALCFVYLNVATAKGTKGNSFFGLAIGFTAGAGAFAVGKVSGGVFNPAVGTSLLLMGAYSVKTILIYMVTQLVAGASAAIVFQQVNSE